MKIVRRRLESISLAFVTALVALLVLIACAPISSPSESAVSVPSETEAATEEVSEAESPSMSTPGAGGTLEYADATECSSLFDLNMDRTQIAMEHNLFWTWHLNFNLRPASDPDLGFQACLHFYWRHDQSAPFQASGRYILTPCTYVSSVSNLPITTTAALSTSFALHTRDAVGLHLEGGDYITCTLNLGAYGVEFAQSTELMDEINGYQPVVSGTVDFGSMLTTVQDELNNLESLAPMQYSSFSFGAAAQFADDAPNSVQPLVYYDPQNCPASKNCANFTLDRELIDGPFGVVRGEISNTLYYVDPNGECGNVACLFNHEGVVDYSIMEYGWVTATIPPPYSCSQPLAQDAPYLLFSARLMSDVVNAWSLWCPDVITPTISASASPDGLWTIPPYWTGLSTIYGGYNPFTGDFLTGDLYEIWVDPDGSGTHSMSSDNE